MKNKTDKLHFLSLKQNKLPKPQTESENSDIPNVTSASDDHNGNSSKSKPKREWIKKSKYRRKQKQLKKQKISVVFNYSDIEISKGAEKVLNRGLNFSVTPDKLNFTQVLVDLAKFERVMEWKEFWHDQPSDAPYVPPLFKKQKTNKPKNPSQSLKTFIQAVKSEIKDPKNRNITRPNLPSDELAGLKELIQLQRERKLCIKPCDKGAGVILLNYQDYMDSCYKHLASVQKQEDGTYKKYYQPVDDMKLLDDVKENVNNLLDDALKDKVITEDEKEAMMPGDAGAGKFYCLYKVHKEHTAPNVPPERPIISCSGSYTQNIGKFVDHHIKPLANTHSTYLQDTPHYLRELDELNKSENIKDTDVLVTIDVCSLYTNIPQSEGIESVREALDERKEKKVPTNFIISLLQIILMFNIFEFNSDFFIQLIGTAMGAVPAVSYANIFMARRIDPKILAVAEKFKYGGKSPIVFMKRFLDDIKMVWRGSSEDLHKFLSEINKIHSSIKFTMSHTTNANSTCDCSPSSSIPFLDTSCSISDGKIHTDLYKKSTDRNQYLLTSSCHPSHVCDSIPYSLALRIVRICSTIAAREVRFSELKEMLLAREYSAGVINAAISRARNIPREEALRKVFREKNSDRPVLTIQYHPALPSISRIINRHWRSMTLDPHMKSIFPKPPLVAYRKQKNLKEYLIRSKVPPLISRPKRILPGMKKCNRCTYCSYIQTGPHVTSTASDYHHQIQQSVNCNTSNIIYLITCLKCSIQYVGETDRSMKERFCEHKCYVTSQQLDKATGAHFNQKGHSVSDMRITILEKVHNKDPFYRKEREHMYINLFDTKDHGLNKKS